MNGRSNTPAGAPADVFVLVGDCLRSADVTAETMPFVRSFADLEFERCYAPSTWTLPAHASLYAGVSPVEHGVTRRGQALSPSQARLPRAARDAGYRTALFSENPTYSTRYGFHHGMDYVDDFVDSKLFPSEFALEHELEGMSAEDVRSAARAALATGSIRTLLNCAYAPLSYVRSRRGTGFPHRGDRVLSHLDAQVSGTDEPTFAIANLLEPHNPHSVPPERGAEALGVSVDGAERAALAALDDNKRYLFEDRDAPPTDAQDRFTDWEPVFERRRDVYRAQVRHLDLLLEEWVGGLDDDVRRNSLIVVTGDHGQLFGEEGMVGHHTSLHPHGIEVPLLVSLPQQWSAGTPVAEPVSWIGLSRALADVAAGRVSGGDEFAAAIREESTVGGSDGSIGAGGSGGPILVAADGPTWNVERLRDRYDDERVDELAVRKVGLIEGDRQVVYESGWDDDDAVSKAVYGLRDGGRELLSSDADVEPHREYREWLVGDRPERADPVASARLEQLGYL